MDAVRPLLPFKKRPDGLPWGSGCGTAQNDWLVPDEFLSKSFFKACQEHDFCYGTCGSNKSTCDNNFLRDLLDACERGGGGVPCRTAARSYYGMMGSPLSRKAFEDAQRKACENC